MEQETKEIDINQKNDVINESETFDDANETPAKSGCLKTLVAFIVASLCALVSGIGICMSPFILGEGTGFEHYYQIVKWIIGTIWIGASFIVPVIVFVKVLSKLEN